MTHLNHIFIFKTNIQCAEDKQLLHELLDNNPAISEWSIDMEDEDCVLRVISESLQHHQIINLLNSIGFLCSELT